MFSVFSVPFCAPAPASRPALSFAPLSQLLNDLDLYTQEVQSPLEHIVLRRPMRIRRVARPITLTPTFHVRETEAAYEVYSRLPGMKRENLEVDFTEKQTLVVKGSIKQASRESQPEPATTLETTAEETSSLCSDTTSEKKTSIHQATVEDDVDDEDYVSVSASVQTPTETPKSQPASPVAATTQVQEAPAQQNENVVEDEILGHFSRTISFPARVDPEGLTAGFHNDILKVTVPKAKAHQPRRIIVN